MKHLLDSLQASLALSPVGIAVQLPGGLRLGDANAELRLQFRDRMGVVAQIHARRFNWGWTARLLEAHYRELAS